MHPRRHLRRIELRHPHVDAHAPHRGDREQRLRSGVAGADQLADLRRAAGDDACERRGDASEVDERLQPPDIGRGRIGQRTLGGEIAGLLVGLLLRDGILLLEVGPARRGRLREVLVGTRGLQVRVRGGELLLDLGRVDHREQLPRLHRRADVDIPFAHIAGSAGIYRRAVVGLDVAGQHQRVRTCHGLGVEHLHRRHRLRLRPFAELPVGMAARQDAPCGEHHRDDRGDDADPLERACLGDVRHSLPPDGRRRRPAGPCDARPRRRPARTSASRRSRRAARRSPHDPMARSARRPRRSRRPSAAFR